MSLHPDLVDIAPIATLENLPKGQVDIDSVPVTWRADFAVLLDETQAKANILHVPEASQTILFELQRRLAEQGFQEIDPCRCTRDIIQLIYERDSFVPDNLLGADDATDIERFAYGLIENAIQEKASDIHIESREDRALVYFRVDGRRRLISALSPQTARSLGVVLYSVHADASSKDVAWDSQQVMDGVIEYHSHQGQHAQLRFSSAPIFPTGCFHIVIRVLLMDTSDLRLSDLGYRKDQQTTLVDLSTGLSGLVILCGPTNSGKSTTLQALMKSIYARLGESIKMITVEDPVEYIIPGACQIGVARKRRTLIDDKTGSAYTTLLKGSLRQDPDVVMVGEIRDNESASVVKDLVLAGRKVLTTLHTYSAIWAFVRLRELGVPIELMTMPGFISGIVYQRLVPTLCPHCKRDAKLHLSDLNESVRTRLLSAANLDQHSIYLLGKGCDKCKGSGVSGRTLCAEFVVPDKRLLDLIARQKYLEAEEHWLNARHLMVPELGVSALAHGIEKMRLGLIDPRDLENCIGLLDSLRGHT